MIKCDSKKLSRLPLINRLENGFLGGNYFETLFLPFLCPNHYISRDFFGLRGGLPKISSDEGEGLPISGRKLSKGTPGYMPISHDFFEIHFSKI